MPHSRKKQIGRKFKLSNVARVNSITKSSKKKKVTIKRSKIGGGDKIGLEYTYPKEPNLEKLSDLQLDKCQKFRKNYMCNKGGFAHIFYLKKKKKILEKSEEYVLRIVKRKETEGTDFENEKTALDKHLKIQTRACLNNYLCKMYGYGLFKSLKDTTKYTLNLPNPNSKYEEYFEDGNLFSIQEKLLGGDIFDYLKEYVDKEKWEIIKKKKHLGILIQIARGLELISTNGFVHLDIKKENILFKKKKKDAYKHDFITEVKIIDFGFLREKSNKFVSAPGSAGFMSPLLVLQTVLSLSEQVGYDYYYDVFSFGILMYMLFNDREGILNMYSRIDFDDLNRQYRFISRLIDKKKNKLSIDKNDNFELIIETIYLLCINCKSFKRNEYDYNDYYSIYNTTDGKPYTPQMVEILYGIHTSTIPGDLKTKLIDKGEDFLIPGLLTLIKNFFSPEEYEQKIIGNGIGSLEDFVLTNAEDEDKAKKKIKPRNGHYLKKTVDGKYYFCYGKKNESESERIVEDESESGSKPEYESESKPESESESGSQPEYEYESESVIILEDELSTEGTRLVRAYNDKLLEKQMSLCGLYLGK